MDSAPNQEPGVSLWRALTPAGMADWPPKPQCCLIPGRSLAGVCWSIMKVCAFERESSTACVARCPLSGSAASQPCAAACHAQASLAERDGRWRCPQAPAWTAWKRLWCGRPASSRCPAFCGPMEVCWVLLGPSSLCMDTCM